MILTTQCTLNQHIESARRQMATGRPHLAMKSAWRVLRKQPGHVGARLLLAEAMLVVDDLEEALHHLDVADMYLRERNAPALSQSTRHLVLRGRVLQRLGRTTDAISAWREAVNRQPRSKVALRSLATVLLEINEPEQAKTLAERALALHPTDATARGIFIEACCATGQYDLAIKTLQQHARHRALARGRTRGMRFTRSECLQLARLMRHSDRTADAMDLYHRLSAAAEADSELACEWAELAVEIGDETQAGHLLQTALRNDPNCERAAQLLGAQHMRLGQFMTAGRIWWRLHQKDRDAVEPLAHLLVCAMITARHDLADRVEKRFASTGHETQRRDAVAAAWHVAVPGEILTKLLLPAEGANPQCMIDGLLTEALTTFERQLADGGNYADLHYHLAVCHNELAEPAGAADCLDRALAANPGYVDAACLRARLLIDAGHLEAAAAVLRAAAERHPYDERIVAARQNYADLCHRNATIVADAA